MLASLEHLQRLALERMVPADDGHVLRRVASIVIRSLYWGTPGPGLRM